MSAHLDEQTLEALAHGRHDLVTDAVRAHARGCAECGARVEEARSLSASLARALAADPPVLDDAELASLVATAIARAELVPPPSRRALGASALGAVLVLAACGVVSYRGLPTVAGLTGLLHDGLHLGVAVDRVVRALVPGGWGALALAAAVVALFVAWPLSRLGGLALRGRVAAPAAVLLVSLGLAGQARAVDFVGDWPAGEKVTITASHAHLSQVLARAAEGAGLGYVGTLDDDPEVSVSVREAPLRDFLGALLGDAPLRVEHAPGLLVVRPLASARAPGDDGGVTPTADVDAGTTEATAPEPPEPPTLPGLPEPPTPPEPPRPPAIPAVPPAPASGGVARDRVTFGGDVVVREGERVRSVVTMGGDADIAGEVLGDVTSMGGDVHVRRTGVVHGELVSMGGRIDVEPGASVPADGVRAQLGGPRRAHGHDDDDDDGPAVRPTGLDPLAVLGAAAADVAGNIARFALLFLVGLLLLALAPRRLAEVQRVVRAEPLRALAVGALSAAFALAVGVVLLVSIVGIAGAVALLITAVLAGYSGLTAVALVLGAALPLRAVHGKPLAELAVGVAVLALVSFVPFFGTLAVLVATLAGGGAVVLTRGGVGKRGPPPADVPAPSTDDAPAP